MKQHRNEIYLAITATALVLAIILGVNYRVNRQVVKAEPAQTVTTIAEKEKKDKVLISVNTEVVRSGLVGMGILITQEYYSTQVETYTKEKKLFNIFPSSSGFTYSYDGAVKAGVDFRKIKVDTDEINRIISVEMPVSEIQAVTIDKNTFKIYSEKDSLWNPLKLEDFNISLAEFEAAAKEKAISDGILERSDKQAVSLVCSFISSLPNTANYTVEFR